MRREIFSMDDFVDTCLKEVNKLKIEDTTVNKHVSTKSSIENISRLILLPPLVDELTYAHTLL